MNDTLIVHWGDEPVGRLWLDAEMSLHFQYGPGWLSAQDALPISLRLPLRAEAFQADAARSFFANLLPEARIRTLIAKKLGVSEGNDFKLLEALGGECAGSLSILPEGRTPMAGGGYRRLSEDELAGMIEEMPRTPLLSAREGLRLSLAGAQNKLPVFVKDGSLYLPEGTSASSHILKPKIPEFPGTVENEWFCMTLGRECGLPVPETDIRDGKHRTLLVRRYDRLDVGGSLTRLHQEDFCQALGYGHERKYQDEGGPGVKECFSLLREHSSDPILDKRSLLRWAVFNYLIGNCDAHAKNISLLIAKDGVRLAPFYDLMSTVVYKGLARNLAMKIGGEKRPEWITKRHWERLAAEAEVSPKAVIGICLELGAALPPAAAELAARSRERCGKTEEIAAIIAYSSSMSARLLKNLA